MPHEPIIKFTDEQWDQFDKLCAIFCTKQEIAEWFGISADTVERLTEREKGMGFRDYWTLKAARGRVSLRRKQFERALAGDTAMLKTLGQQYLGQSDKSQSMNVNVNHPSGVDLPQGIEPARVQKALQTDPAFKLITGGKGE